MRYLSTIAACFATLLLSLGVHARDEKTNGSPKPIVLIEGRDIYYLAKGRQLDARFNHLTESRKLLNDVPIEGKVRDLPWLYGAFKNYRIGLVSGMPEVLRTLAVEGYSFYVHAPVIGHKNSADVRSEDNLLTLFRNVTVGRSGRPVFLRAHSRLQHLQAPSMISFRDLLSKRPDLETLVSDKEHLSAVLQAGGYEASPEAKQATPTVRARPKATRPKPPTPTAPRLRQLENSKLGRHVAEICAVICDELIRSAKRAGDGLRETMNQLVTTTREHLELDNFTAEPRAIETAIQATARGAYGTPPASLIELLAPAPPPAPPAPPPVEAKPTSLRAFLGRWLTEHFDALKAEWLRQENDIRDLTDRRIAEIVLHDAREKGIGSLPKADVLAHSLSVVKVPELRRPPSKRSFPQSYLDLPSRKPSRFDATKERPALLDLFATSRLNAAEPHPPVPAAPSAPAKPITATARSFFVRWMKEHWDLLREEWLDQTRPLNELTDRRIAEIISEEGKNTGIPALSNAATVTRNLEQARRADLQRPESQRVFPKSYLAMPPRVKAAFHPDKERAELLEIFAASQQRVAGASAPEPQSAVESVRSFLVRWMNKHWDPLRKEWLLQGRPLEHLTERRIVEILLADPESQGVKDLPDADHLTNSLRQARLDDLGKPESERQFPKSYLSRPRGTTRRFYPERERAGLLEVFRRSLGETPIEAPAAARPAQEPSPSVRSEGPPRPGSSRDYVTRFMPTLLYAIEAFAREQGLPLKKPTAESMTTLLTTLLSSRAVSPQPNPNTLRMTVWRYMTQERPGPVSRNFSEKILAGQDSVLKIAGSILDTTPRVLEFLPPVWEWLAYQERTRGLPEEALSRLPHSIAEQVATNYGDEKTPPEEVIKYSVDFLRRHPEAFRTEAQAKLSGFFETRPALEAAPSVVEPQVPQPAPPPKAAPVPAAADREPMMATAQMRDYRREILTDAAIRGLEAVRDVNDGDKLFRWLVKQPGLGDPKSIILLDAFCRDQRRPNLDKLRELLRSEGEEYSATEMRGILALAARRVLRYQGFTVPKAAAQPTAQGLNQDLYATIDRSRNRERMLEDWRRPLQLADDLGVRLTFSNMHPLNGLFPYSLAPAQIDENSSQSWTLTVLGARTNFPQIRELANYVSRDLYILLKDLEARTRLFQSQDLASSSRRFANWIAKQRNPSFLTGGLVQEARSVLESIHQASDGTSNDWVLIDQVLEDTIERDLQGYTKKVMATRASEDSGRFAELDDPQARSVTERYGRVFSKKDLERIEAIRKGMSESEQAHFDEILKKGRTIEEARAKALRR